MSTRNVRSIQLKSVRVLLQHNTENDLKGRYLQADDRARDPKIDQAMLS